MDFDDGYATDFEETAFPPGVHALPTPERTELHVESWEDFAAVKEPAAESLMGTKETCALPAGGTCLLYGKGGAGKTTLEVDWLAHLGAGDDWLGLEVARPINVLAIENEGPRYKFREKISDKLNGWTGSEIEGRCKMLADPWATFDFTNLEHLKLLAEVIAELDTDLLAAGPINRLGMRGGGTSDDIGDFMGWVEGLRQMLERPLAVMFAHHDNKTGDVSGAWHGVPDTLVQVKAIGPGSTLVWWEKVRWGSDLHQQTWTLGWREGSTYQKIEHEGRTAEEMEADMVAFISENPGSSWRAVRDAVQGGAQELQEIRDLLLRSESLKNSGRGNKFELYVNGSAVRAVQPAWNLGPNQSQTTFPVDGGSEVVRGSYRIEKYGTNRTAHGPEYEPKPEDLDFGDRSNGDDDIPW